MPAYPQTGSILANNDGTNRTGTSLSTNIVIKVGNNTVGAVQELSINEDRPIQMIDEVGTDGHIDSAPRSSANFSGSCRRIRFDRMRISESFSRGFLHVHAQRVPFDLVIIDKWNDDVESAIVTIVKNVWIKGLSYSYSAQEFIITDNMQWEAETISSHLGTGAKNAATGGERGIPLAINAIEQQADRGDRRGALDAPGLIKAFTSII